MPMHPLRRVLIVLWAGVAAACTTEGQQYSDNPVDALEATKKYLKDSGDYDSRNQVAGQGITAIIL